uniref:histone deacetylase n=1 Tax=Arcella intermedia TaxID=1963864 RepID=A0A6B2L653_9EUKA
MKPESKPLIYSPNYNISFLGLEKLHPFDSCKYSKVVGFLEEANLIKTKHLVKPKKKPTYHHLLKVHSPAYLESLNTSLTVAQVTELLFLAAIPHFIIQKQVLDPFLYATSGSILAGHVAMERGWAINLSGGYHHCSFNQGGGFCAYSDITLCYHYVRQFYPKVKRVMIIDLDAHQGNGHENDKLHFDDEDAFILDMFNYAVYPGDKYAKQAINIAINAHDGIEDEEYLTKLESGLDQAFNVFKPDFIIYNAGTDILSGDPLGDMQLTANGVIKRDEMVFTSAFQNKAPIAMLLSGGYQQCNARVIADSIINLHKKFNLLDDVVLPTVQCKNCGKQFDPVNNKKGECSHTSTYHGTYGDCSYVKCALGLGSNIGYQHWGCCFKKDKNDNVCSKSKKHVS